MRLSTIISAIAFAVGMLAPAIAQQPVAQPSSGGTPEKMPFDIPYGAPITLARAKEVLAAAEAEAIKRNWKESISVVNASGELIAFARMDDSLIAGIKISENKAITAVRFRRDTKFFYDRVDAGHAEFLTLDPYMIAMPGGFPLVENGKLIGAIGCSGATGDQDALVCKVGADMIK